jgi:hypothetical protein
MRTSAYRQGMVYTVDLGSQVLQDSFGDLDISQQWADYQKIFLAECDTSCDTTFDLELFFLCLAVSLKDSIGGSTSNLGRSHPN